MYNSQWSQDKWLNENIFKNKRNGFFVDVGAHDGVDINNSLFYERHLNWKGICIEPIPKIFAKLKKNRQAICINGCAYDRNGIVQFNCIEGYCEMLSGVATDYANEHLHRIEREMKQHGGKRTVLYSNSYRLDTIFDTYDVKNVDYLGIDTEGTEMNVLRGIDFDKVRIEVIEVEVNYPQDEKNIDQFLTQNGYKFRVKLGGDVVYTRV